MACVMLMASNRKHVQLTLGTRASLLQISGLVIWHPRDNFSLLILETLTSKIYLLPVLEKQAPAREVVLPPICELPGEKLVQEWSWKFGMLEKVLRGGVFSVWVCRTCVLNSWLRLAHAQEWGPCSDVG